MMAAEPSSILGMAATVPSPVPTLDDPVPTLDDPATLAADAAEAGEELSACLRVARTWGARLPLPGSGRTMDRLALLAAAGEGDLTAARVLEPHADALAILAEAGEPPDAQRVWGVFAAEARDCRLVAHHDRRGWLLDGTKPWCSLARRLDAALVTAHTERGRALFAVDLRQAGVHPHVGGWVARGLRHVDSGPVDFTAVSAAPIGEPGWYLQRDGFAWGAVGVAACWYGGARGVYRTLERTLAGRDDLDRVLAMNAGRADAALFASDACLRIAALDIDAGRAAAQAGALVAARVRAVVVAAAEVVLCQVGHALGPAPLAFDDVHARRVADLTLYLRQDHGERDLAELGLAVTAHGRG